jgi:hypothetical protein
MAVLSSDWGGLSPHLLAAFYPVAMERQGDTRSFRRVGDIVVAAPISDASMEQTANWTSPFENQMPVSRRSRTCCRRVRWSRS